MTKNIAFKVVFKSTSLNSLPLREGLRLGDEISWLLTILEKKRTVQYHFYLAITFKTQTAEEILVIEM